MKERHALLQRVLWSRPVKSSERIREFLQYVCERTLQEPDAEVHEQEIGHRVFGRSPEYDTTADNIVRVTASQARKRLEQYFASDGITEPIILDIPKGKYTPVFREREAAPPEALAAASSSVASQVVRYRRAAVGFAVLAVLLAAVVAWQAAGLRNRPLTGRTQLEASPALHALWSQLLLPGGRTDIVVADSSLSLYQELLDRQMSLQEYVNAGGWPSPANGPSSDLSAFARLAAQRGFTSIGSVTLAYRLGQLASGTGSSVSIMRARDFNVRLMKSDSVILLGSSRANPWDEVIQDRLKFRFGFDQQTRHAYFTNSDVRSGEQAIYRSDTGVSYCRIALLPNLTGNGSVLSISGTEVEGTEGGGEFTTDEHSMEELRSLLGATGNSPVPYFEALLRSSRLGGATPHLTIVTYRRIHR